MKQILVAKKLNVSIAGKKIVHGIDLTIGAGSFHVLMGPNGSGKSTIAYALAGHPHYSVTAAALNFAGKPLLKQTVDERARNGLFLGMQYPQTIPGLSLSHVLPLAMQARFKNPKEKVTQHITLAGRMAAAATREREQLRSDLDTYLPILGMHEDMLYRSVNEGFSGGEKKKAEVLQMLALKPKLAILDEPDSGVDVDALRKIAAAINKAHKAGTAILLITHYNRILKYLKPDRIHILAGGKVVSSGTAALAKKVEKEGYEGLIRKS